MKVPALAAALSLLAASAGAGDVTAGNLLIQNARSFETPKTAMAAGGFLDITNQGGTDDRLVGVEGPFMRTMLHESKVTDGVATMSHVMGIEIPAGATVSLAPGGYHIMFMGLNGDPLEVGEEVPVTLVFEKAGPVEVVLTVEPRREGDPATPSN